MKQLSLSLLVKLGSIIEHFDEATSFGGHDYDLKSAQELLKDVEVEKWRESMRQEGFLPLKRKPEENIKRLKKGK